MNFLLPFFPKTDKIIEIRENQKEALDKIWSVLETGCTKITICAPVGSGKSALADTLFNYYKSQGKTSLYTSPLNQLVDQVDKSGFQDIYTLKGRINYPCLADKQNCSEGWCQNNKCPSSKRKRNCNSKPYDACDKCLCWKCIYKAAYNRFKHSTKGNTNFSLMLLGIDNNPDVLVLDECDVAESFIRSHHGLTIPKLIDDLNFKHHVDKLREYSEELFLQISSIDILSENTTDIQQKEYKELNKLYDKISYLISDYETHQEPWVITIDKIKSKTKYEPITVNRFLDPLFEGKIVFMMSATPPKFPGFTMIEVDSIFPIETRQWSEVPLGKMSKDYRENTIPQLAWWLSQLKGKTIVHCVSYATAQKISDALRILEKYPLLQTNQNNVNDEHSTNRYDAINAFITAKDQDKILLSVKLDRGVDLWQPEIINNVICVVPWPNPTEPLTIAKNKLLPLSWKDEQMAQDIMQMYGRIHRNEQMGIYQGVKIPKQTYIVDSNFKRWYINNKNLFHDWFTKAKNKKINTKV